MCGAIAEGFPSEIHLARVMVAWEGRGEGWWGPDMGSVDGQDPMGINSHHCA